MTFVLRLHLLASSSCELGSVGLLLSCSNLTNFPLPLPPEQVLFHRFALLGCLLTQFADIHFPFFAHVLLRACDDGHAFWRCHSTEMDLIPDENTVKLTLCQSLAVEFCSVARAKVGQKKFPLSIELESSVKATRGGLQGLQDNSATWMPTNDKPTFVSCSIHGQRLRKLQRPACDQIHPKPIRRFLCPLGWLVNRTGHGSTMATS
mmetsp:Transcript_33585/g.70998  ORF Transcript_33585/g.70998 Transcript_33585/m.70998 type:complete len:206 (-) Transcript_33585:8-625(-)